MLYTSRFQNPELKSGDYTTIRISLGAPRWSKGYSLDGSIKELMPAGLKHIDDIVEFSKLYYEQLDSFGVENIEKQLRYYESLGKPRILKSSSGLFQLLSKKQLEGTDENEFGS